MSLGRYISHLLRNISRNAVLLAPPKLQFPSNIIMLWCFDNVGQVWDLSDIDKDGHLDKDEFAVVSLIFIPSKYSL